MIVAAIVVLTGAASLAIGVLALLIAERDREEANDRLRLAAIAHREAEARSYQTHGSQYRWVATGGSSTR